jgi:arylsulfatase A-like enzyme
MRVPLIVRDPSSTANATRGKTLGGFVESIDIAPTILELKGMVIPDRVQGKSLAGRIRGSEEPGKSEIHYEKDFRHIPGMDPDECLLWVVRDEQYKYVHFADASIPSLLFDLKADPGESNNVAEDPETAQIQLSYCQKLLQWRMKNEDQRMEHWASQFK